MTLHLLHITVVTILACLMPNVKAVESDALDVQRFCKPGTSYHLNSKVMICFVRSDETSGQLPSLDAEENLKMEHPSSDFSSLVKKVGQHKFIFQHFLILHF